MVDMRRRDEKGLTICPQCLKHYKPILGERPKDDPRSIQKIFSLAKSYEREQLLTGLCFDECWDKFLGVKK